MNVFKYIILIVVVIWQDKGKKRIGQGFEEESILR